MLNLLASRDEVRQRLPGEFGALAVECNAMVNAREAGDGRLRESEQRYADMLDGVDMLAITLEHEGRLTHCNDALLRLTGWTRDEVIGQPWAQHFVAPGSARAIDLPGLTRGDRSSRSEGHLLTRAGEHRMIGWAHTWTKPIEFGPFLTELAALLTGRHPTAHPRTDTVSG